MNKYIILLFGLILSNCNTKTSNPIDTTKQLFRGHLIYNVSGESTNSGWTFNVKFDQNNVRINEGYALTSSKTKIIDKKSDEALCLYSDFTIHNLKFKKTYFMYKTIDEVFNENIGSNYQKSVTKTITNEFKSILGFKCRKIILKIGKQHIIELWTTDLIQTGVMIPKTPLEFKNIALEYELKVLGEINRKYTIKEIKYISDAESDFKHLVSKEYNSLSYFNLFEKDIIIKPFNSLIHPSFSGGREFVKIYFEDKLNDIHKKLGNKSLKYSVEFIVTKKGNVEDVKIHNFIKTKEYNDIIVNIFKNTPKWSPGKVKGNPVNTKVRITIN
jgi:hypothetical protein